VPGYVVLDCAQTAHVSLRVNVNVKVEAEMGSLTGTSVGNTTRACTMAASRALKLVAGSAPDPSLFLSRSVQ
jgi:hypothetical protein